MDTRMVFAKTDKGHEEIEKRTFHLNFRHRTALILVDGEQAVDALLGKLPGDGVTLLNELLRDGFIAAARGNVPASPTESLPGIAAGNTAEFDLETVKHRAVRTIDALLGPDGESLALAIERSDTKAEFARQAQRTRDVISQLAGQRKADQFWAATGLQ